MGGELAERAFEGAQGFDIVLAAIILLEAADFRLQRLVRLAHLVDQAFDMAGDGGGRLLSVLEAGNEAENGVVDAVDGEGRARFGRFDAAGEAVERRGRVGRLNGRVGLGLRHRRLGDAGAARIGIRGLAGLRLVHGRQQPVQVFTEGDSLSHGGFAGSVAGPLIRAELAPRSALAHAPLLTPGRPSTWLRRTAELFTHAQKCLRVR